jgi:hypothetical protein
MTKFLSWKAEGADEGTMGDGQMIAGNIIVLEYVVIMKIWRNKATKRSLAKRERSLHNYFADPQTV